MKNNNNLVIGIVLVVVLIGGLIYCYNPGGLDLKTKDGFIEVQLIDGNGNVINPFSVVQGIPGVSSMRFTINAKNTGTKDLQCNIVSTKVNGAVNTAFDTAFSKTTKLVPSVEPKKASWTSEPISVSQFESLSQPVTFSVTLRCTYMSGNNKITLEDKTGSISLTITQDEGGSFDVDIGSGGLPTEFCGDGICQVNEDSSTCSVDCGFSADTVNFRTNDPTYVSGSGIAYSGTCGNELTAYGYATTYSVYYSTNCVTVTQHQASGCGTATTLMTGLPGGWLSGGSSPVLLTCSDKPGNLYVCDTDSEKGQVRRFYTAVATSVETTPTTLDDPEREVLCETSSQEPAQEPVEFCGDGICNNGETSTTCLSDCPSSQVVIFRTNSYDGNYQNDDWIVYDLNSDGNLECFIASGGYGYSTPQPTFFSDLYGKSWSRNPDFIDGLLRYREFTGTTYIYNSFVPDDDYVCEISNTPLAEYSTREMYA